MNVIDNLIGFFSPKWAAERAKSRYLMNSYRDYDAASRGRRTKGRYAPSTSANTENRKAIVDLRNRSRELVRNNPYAKRAVQLIATNVVGSGIRPTFVGKSKRAEATIKAAWKDWADSTKCDFDGRKTFYGIQRLVMRELVETGEVLVRLRKVKGQIPIQLQVLEADHIATDREMVGAGNNGGYTMQGVEFNSKGKRVAYWLYDVHPGETFIRSATANRIPADEVLHIFREDRAGQIRGVPEAASVILRLADFDDYEDAELMRQKIAACYVGFVSNDPNMDLPASGGSADSDDELEKFEPGAIEYLPPGKQITFAQPPVTQSYDVYGKSVLRSVAAGFGVTYEGLTNDLSNVNFSSGRMGAMEFHRVIQEWQEQVLITQLCNNVFAWFIDAAQVAMLIGENVGVSVSWTPPRRVMIDPSKEVKSMTDAIRAGLTSWQEVAREQGYDPDELLEQIKSDKAKFDAAGVILSSDYANDAMYIASAAKAQANTNQ